MPTLSNQARSIPPSGIRRIFELARTLDNVIPLGLGEPELAVPAHILEAGSQAWLDDFTNYTPGSGIPELRHLILDKVRTHNGVAAELEQVHVTADGTHALLAAMALTLDPGDEVLIPDPGFATFAMAPRVVGGVPVPYTLHAQNGFVPDIADIEKAITPRTKVLLINSPSNPLGVVLHVDVLRDLLDLAKRHDLWIISDEVYEYFTYGLPHTSIAALGDPTASSRSSLFPRPTH